MKIGLTRISFLPRLGFSDEPEEEISHEQSEVINLEEVEDSVMPDQSLIQQPAPGQVDIEAIDEGLPEHIMEILGDAPVSGKKFGPPLNNNIAVRWEHIATNGLEKDSKKQLMDKYPIPENMQVINAPILNNEVKAALSEVLIKKDGAIQSKQKQIAVISTCLGQAMSLMLEKKDLDEKLFKYLLENWCVNSSILNQ